MFILLLISLAASIARSAPEAHDIAQVGVIVENSTDFRSHSIVTAGIRRLTAARDATDDNDHSRDASIYTVYTAMRPIAHIELISSGVTSPRSAC